MKTVAILMLAICPLFSFGETEGKNVMISCNSLEWNDIEALVAPYLDETHSVALTMQGQSSEYRVSTAAEQAMVHSKNLPNIVKQILQAIIDAEC